MDGATDANKEALFLRLRGQKKPTSLEWRVNDESVLVFGRTVPLRVKPKQQLANHKRCRTKMAAYNFQALKPQHKTA